MAGCRTLCWLASWIHHSSFNRLHFVGLTFPRKPKQQQTKNNAMTNPASTIAFKLAVVSRPPPPKAVGRSTKQKDHFSMMIEGLTPGQCIEYRGDIKPSAVSVRVLKASKDTGKKYTTRKAEGGMDIYCIAAAPETPAVPETPEAPPAA